MALYAIGDTHLSLASDKPMDVFGGRWQDYQEKLKKGLSILSDEDTIVLCGDISWGMSLEEALPDFQFLDSLPGKKLLLKGNHDYWWNTASKIRSFFEQNEITTLNILHNNCYYYGSTALCGTRGWFYEEQVHGGEHDKKIMNREVMRLRASLAAAGDCGEKIVFLHYPPRFYRFICRELIAVMEEYGVKDCYYGHLHGEGHRYAVTGETEGIRYHMISSDYLNFMPVRIL